MLKLLFAGALALLLALPARAGDLPEEPTEAAMTMPPNNAASVIEAQRPSSPSVMLKALIRATPANTVNATSNRPSDSTLPSGMRCPRSAILRPPHSAISQTLTPCRTSRT